MKSALSHLNLEDSYLDDARARRMLDGGFPQLRALGVASNPGLTHDALVELSTSSALPRLERVYSSVDAQTRAQVEVEARDACGARVTHDYGPLPGWNSAFWLR